MSFKALILTVLLFVVVKKSQGEFSSFSYIPIVILTYLSRYLPLLLPKKELGIRCLKTPNEAKHFPLQLLYKNKHTYLEGNTDFVERWVTYLLGITIFPQLLTATNILYSIYFGTVNFTASPSICMVQSPVRKVGILNSTSR